TDCAPKSSRSVRPTSCASSSSGSTSIHPHGSPGSTDSAPRSRRSTASSWPRARGSDRCCRRAWTGTTRRSSTRCASWATSAGRDAALETQDWALLRRYGVVFRRLLAREANAAPWRDLARVYRRLEARGEIRGGRFVSGMSGEQFALGDAVDRLREVRRSAHD